MQFHRVFMKETLHLLADPLIIRFVEFVSSSVLPPFCADVICCVRCSDFIYVLRNEKDILVKPVLPKMMQVPAWSKFISS